MIKAILVSVIAFVICIGFLVFTSWGIDPASWRPEMRGLAYALTLTVTVGVGCIAHQSEDSDHE